jgi:hypothetical protein
LISLSWRHVFDPGFLHATPAHRHNSCDHVVRTIHMDAEHPADVQPSLHGHSIGRWEGEKLVIDTIAYEPSPSGIGMNVPSSPAKHTVERLTLTADRTRPAL